MSDLDWLLGYVEGEGCFTTIAQVDNDLHFGLRIRPRFDIGVSKKEQETIYSIRDFLWERDISSIAKLRFVVSGLSKAKHWRSCLTICGIKENLKFCDLLSPLRWHTVKFRDFLKFKYVLAEMDRISHKSRKGILRGNPLTWTVQDYIDILFLRDTMNLGTEGQRHIRNRHKWETYSEKWNVQPSEKIKQFIILTESMNFFKLARDNGTEQILTSSVEEV